MILVACVRVVWSFLAGTVVPSAKKGRLLLTLGWMCLIAMGIRLLVGLTIVPNHFGFGATLPAMFHLVLEDVSKACGMVSEFFVMLASVEDFRYTLCVEHVLPPSDLGPVLEARLSDMNSEFRTKRASGRLQALRVLHLRPGAGGPIDNTV